MGKLAKDDDPCVRLLAALHENTPGAILESLAIDGVDWVREGVAMNPWSPPALLRSLGEAADAGLRYALASNPACPRDIALELAGDDDERLRLLLANAHPDREVWVRIADRASEGRMSAWEEELSRALDPATTLHARHLALSERSRPFLRALFRHFDDVGERDTQNFEFTWSPATQSEIRRTGTRALHALLARALEESDEQAYWAGHRRLQHACIPPCEGLRPYETEDVLDIQMRLATTGISNRWFGDYWLHHSVKGLATAHAADFCVLHSDFGTRAQGAAAPLLNRRLLHLAALDPDSRIRQVVAERPDLTRSLHEILSTDPAKATRKTVLNNASMPADIRERMTKSAVAPSTPSGRESFYVHSNLAFQLRDSETNAARVDALAQHQDPLIRYAAGLHRNLSAKSLQSLASDPVEWVRVAAGYNIHCPEDILEAYASSDDFEFRLAAASHPRCPEAVQLRLAADPHAYIRRQVANLARSEEVWKEILRHSDASRDDEFEELLAKALDRKTTKSRLSSIALRGGGRPVALARAVARHPKCADELLSALGNYLPDDVAENPNYGLLVLETPEITARGVSSRRGKRPPNGWVTDRWVGSGIAELRRSAAKSAGTNIALLQLEVLSPDEHTRARLSERADLNRFMLEALCRDTSKLVHGGLRAYFAKPRLFGGAHERTLVAAVPAATKKKEGKTAAHRTREAKRSRDPEALETLSHDKAYKVRLAVAENRSTASSTLCRLIGDTRHEVALRALSRVATQRNHSDRDFDEDALPLLRTALRQVSDHPRAQLRASAARLVDTHELALKMLADTALDVRDAAVKANRLPEKTQLHLVNETTDAFFHACLASNTQYISVLGRLLEAGYAEYMHSNARCRLTRELAEAILDNDDYRRARPILRFNLDRLPTDRALRFLERLDDAGTRDAASHSSSPAVLRQLMQSASAYVRSRLARNPATPPDVIHELVEDASLEHNVRNQLGSHPNLPPESARLLLQSLQAHCYLLKNPNVPSDVLRSLAAAQCPSTQRRAKDLLAERGEELVAG